MTADIAAAFADLAPDSAKEDCGRCGNRRLLVPLHGDKGGPQLCMPCASQVNLDAAKSAKRWREALRAMGADKLFGVDAGPGEVTRQLLRDAITLCHPDRHPDRIDLATRVTQELTALRPFAVEAEAPKPRDASASARTRLDAKPSHPCQSCRWLAPPLYCDACRNHWNVQQERERRERRQDDAARKREYRARRRRQHKRRCVECDAMYQPARADARYCSPACRQRAHRARSA